MQGKVIAITGAASGIGLATAHYLAARGASLSLADIHQEGLKLAKESINLRTPGSTVKVTVVNVRNSLEVTKWISTTVQELGKLDGAANLAGVFKGSKEGIAGLDDADWHFVLSVNLTGLMYCLRAELQVISKGGSIVNASSVAGLVGSSFFPAYTVSKHGVIGITKCAAKEAGNKEVRVNCICPYVSLRLLLRLDCTISSHVIL